MFWNTFYKLCEENNTKPNTIAKIIGVSSAICTKWKNGTIPNGDTLLKLADYFGVSVDFLLGRTDECKMVGGHSIKTGDIGDNSGHSDTSVKISEIQSKQLDETAQQLVEAFQNLGFFEKTKVMNLIAELSET